MLETKGINLFVKWKGYDNSSNSWVNKSDIIWLWVSIFLGHGSFETNAKVKLALSTFETKSDIKEGTKINIHQNLQTKMVLISLKWDVDKLDLDKLKTVPI